MRIGIFLGNNVPQIGGNFTFEDNLINALLKVKSRHEFYIFYYGNREHSGDGSVKFIPLSKSRLVSLSSALNFSGKKPSDLQKASQKYNIEIMWFLTHSYEDVKIPFISTVLDLEHRVHPFFPEVSVTGNTWEERESHFSSTIPKAAYVVTGTEAGKKEIIRFYHADEERIRVLPFPNYSFALESNINASVLIKYGISSPYLFYPAQFWPHKNHMGLLLALKLLKEKYSLDFSLVLTGSDMGNLKYIKEMVKDLDMVSRVFFLGFVPKEDLTGLYKNAFAMVYASFFGPDNLPPLEAFALGCPVVAAKVSGAEEQMGNAAIFVDPKSEEDIAVAVKKLYNDPGLRDFLIKRGLELVSGWNVLDYINGMISIFEDFEKYRRCWSRKEVYVHL